MKSGRGGKREGSGRKADAVPSKVLRVPGDVSIEEVRAIPSLRIALADWRVKCAGAPDGARYYFLKEALKDLEALGF